MSRMDQPPWIWKPDGAMLKAMPAKVAAACRFAHAKVRAGRPVAIAIILAVLAGCSSGSGRAPIGASSGPGSYAGYTQSYTVPWVDSPEFSNLRHTLKIKASVSGGTASSYTVDTGSVGMVVPASEI